MKVYGITNQIFTGKLRVYGYGYLENPGNYHINAKDIGSISPATDGKHGRGCKIEYVDDNKKPRVLFVPLAEEPKTFDEQYDNLLNTYHIALDTLDKTEIAYNQTSIRKY